MTLFVLSLVATAIFVVGVGIGYYLGHQDGYDLGWRDGFYMKDPSWLPVRDPNTSVRVIGAMPALFDQDS